jgi:hypothetical protein
MDVPYEIVLLNVERGFVPVFVETGLANGYDMRMSNQLFDLSPVGGPGFLNIVGMNASRSGDTRITIRKQNRSLTGLQRRPDGYHAFEAALLSTLNHQIDLLMKSLRIQMAMSIDQGTCHESVVFTFQHRFTADRSTDAQGT